LPEIVSLKSSLIFKYQTRSKCKNLATSHLNYRATKTLMVPANRRFFNYIILKIRLCFSDRNEKIVTMRPEINSNSTERKNDNNDGMRILCHEDPLEKWENLTEIIDEQVIATLQCCYGRGIHMYDTNSNINAEFFISEAEKRLEGEVLSSYLSGINICAQYVTDCDVKFFRKCVEEECASLITF
ncbi:hypothetical protein Avbf_11059, partial [Armadillidium vulgare]